MTCTSLESSICVPLCGGKPRTRGGLCLCELDAFCLQFLVVAIFVVVVDFVVDGVVVMVDGDSDELGDVSEVVLDVELDDSSIGLVTD